MLCRLVRNWLMDYHLEELSERGDRLVEWHLRSCERCRAESRELVNLLNTLQSHLGADWRHMPVEESWERVAQRRASRAPSPLRRLLARAVATGVALAAAAAAWLAFAPGRQDGITKGPQAPHQRAAKRTVAPEALRDTTPAAAGHVVAVDHGSGTITVAAAEGYALSIGQRLRTAPPQLSESTDPTLSFILRVARHRGAGRYQCRVVGPTTGLSRVRPGWSVHLQDGDHPKPNSR